MLSNSTISHALLKLIPDLLEMPSSDHSTIRTFGKLTEYDVYENRASLQFSDKFIQIDTSLLGDFVHPLNQYYQIIGELDTDDELKIVRARIMKPIHNFNEATFEKLIRSMQAVSQ